MSATLPLVTIAVPAFNHEPHVRQALDSMLNSGVPQLEILICDDASTDRTPDLIEAWIAQHRHRFHRVLLLRHQRNLGLCASLNELISLAQGEIIHVIASDDYFLSGGILAKTQALLAHPEWQVAFCDGQAVGPEGQIYLPSLVADAPFLPAQLTPHGMAEELLYHWSPPVHQMSWRRQAFLAHGGEFAYDPGVFCEDYDAALWAAAKQGLGYIPQVCQAYRYRTWPQTTNRNPIKESRDRAHVLAKRARALPPRLRQAYQLLSDIFFATAIEDHEKADLLWMQHRADHTAYLQRLAHPSPNDAAAPEDLPPFNPIAALQASIRHLEQTLQAAHADRALAKKQRAALKAEIATLKHDLTSAHHLLRYHAANPRRALALWWNRRRGLP